MTTPEGMSNALDAIEKEVSRLKRLEMSDELRGGLDRIEAIARYKANVVPRVSASPTEGEEA